MLSAACHELPPLPAEPPAPSLLSFRRIGVTFAPDNRRTQGAPYPRRVSVTAVSVPAYSKIVFRAGAALAR
jgi:uncharacterized protein (DUF934 family)